MSDSSFLTHHDHIKTIALLAVAASCPVELRFGTVKSVDPLEIFIDQKTSYTKEFLVLSSHVTEQGLAAGDQVALLREQGGQRFYVMDRVGD